MTVGPTWRRLAAAAAAAVLARTAAGRRLATRDVPLGGIAADLLIRAANDSDVDAAWRLLGSPTFKDSWFQARGSNGETPLEAALRAGCPELAGLILMHPGFDQETVRRERERRRLFKHAIKRGKEMAPKPVLWAVAVLGGVSKNRRRQEELAADPELARQEGLWFLPRPGEWRAEAALADMGVSLPMRPEFPRNKMSIYLGSPCYASLADQAARKHGNIGMEFDPKVGEQIWYLLVSRVLTKSRERRAELDGHLRSIGWTLWFRGSNVMMAAQWCFLEAVAPTIEVKDLLTYEEARAGAQTIVHMRQVKALQIMDKVLNKIWDKIGRWMPK